MFASFSRKAAALSLAAVAALSVSLASGQANAKIVIKERDAILVGAGLLGGVILGEIVKPRRARRVVVERCVNRLKLIGFDFNDDPVYKRVTICRR
jgi:threonine dehydrogenase-like Zn-dependent dehydrogenase